MRTDTIWNIGVGTVTLAFIGGSSFACAILWTPGTITAEESSRLQVEAEMRSDAFMQMNMEDITVDEYKVPFVANTSAQDRFETAEHTFECKYESETDEEWYMNDFKAPSTISLSESDALMLQKVASAEGYTIGVDGMAHIMRVVLNRVDSTQFPDTIEEVIYQAGQFEVVSNGAYYTAQVDEYTLESLHMIENGWDETYGATYFCTVDASDWHRTVLTEMYRYDNVIFWTYLEQH